MPQRLQRALACVALVSAVVPTAALAGVLVPKEPGQRPLEVRKQSLRVEVKDQVLRATLDEVFENLGEQPVEAIYTLPLPEGGAVSGFATWVDGKRVESRIQEKKQAEKTYEDAKAQQQAPALLEKAEPGLFRTRVDGISPHGTKRVEASFAQILPYDSGVVTLRLPIAVNGAGGEQPVGDFKLSIDVKDQKKISSLDVSSHAAAKVERVGPGAFRVTLEGKGVLPGRELVLSYKTESSRLGLSFVPYKPDGEAEGYFLLLASPQELTTAADIVQKDVVFVFDTSGSMDGEKIAQAREALRRCLSFLNREDRFGIVAFSDAMNPFRAALLPASEENIKEGISFANGLRAGGGTNISGALLSGLKMLEGGERPRVLVFMTDGLPSAGVTSVQDISTLVKQKNQGVARIFPFGVGQDVNRTFLEQLGRENRGAHDFVDAGQSIEAVVGSFYSKISKPVLSDLAFDFGAVTPVMQYPDVLPDLYKGSQLVVVGRYRGSGAVKAKLTGMLNGKKHEIPFEATFPKEESQNTFVARLWAQRRIDFLLAQSRLTGEREEARAEVIALSEQFQILTPYTSLVAVKPTAVASISPQRVKPGDPIIHVRAPQDARAVTVRLPFGETKRARWDDEVGAWAVRFLVPPGTADGSYPISVEVEQADGRKETLALRVSIDTHAPALAVSLPKTRPGALLTLSAQAVVAPGEVFRAVAFREDRYEAVKALFDVRRVTARLWDGREVALKLAPGGLGFKGQAELNSSLAPGLYPVVITAQDFAGNTSRSEAQLEVVAP